MAASVQIEDGSLTVKVAICSMSHMNPEIISVETVSPHDPILEEIAPAGGRLTAIERLPERYKLAIEYADVLIHHPAGLGDDLRARLAAAPAADVQPQQHRMQQPGQHHDDARGVVALRQRHGRHQVAHSHHQAQAQAGQGFTG